MKSSALFSALILLLSLSCAGLFAAEYHVNQDGTGDFEAIQEAIDAAATGDTIVVAPGTYEAGIDFKGKAIMVMSSEGPEVTIIEGDRFDSRGVSFASGEAETSVLAGFTITDCYEYLDNGGGISCIDSSPTIRDNVITGNAAGSVIEWVFGGGIYCERASPTIVNNVISGNFTSGTKWGRGYGGGICCLDSSPLIMNNLIVGNGAGSGQSYYGYSFSDGRGGAIYCERSSPTILFCTFYGNFTLGEHNLGGLHFEGSSVATVANCIIAGTHNSLGEASFNYCCFDGDAPPGCGNFSADPLFARGPLSDCYLSYADAGYEQDSPCVNAGMGMPSEYGFSGLTTRTDSVPDTRTVDMGYHFPCVEARGGEFYIDAENGDDSNSGMSPEDAFQTVSPVLRARCSTPDDPITINLLPGEYDTIPMMA